jgi:beta-mannanase
MCGSVRGALGNRRPYRDRTESARQITNEPWSSMQRRKNKKENEREKLFQVKRKRSAQKVLARADIVRDVRFRR